MNGFLTDTCLKIKMHIEMSRSMTNKTNKTIFAI